MTLRLAAAAAGLLAGGASAGAATIAIGDATSALHPSFFVDDAVIGGTDTTVSQPSVAGYNRSFAGLLNPNQGPTPVTLTGFAFASSSAATSNTATSLSVTFTYLGADEAVGGGDDVVIGTATGTYAYTTAGEYVFVFDTPLTATLNITGVRFLIQIAPTNAGGTGKVLFKTASLTYEAAAGPKFSVSGYARSTRVNLAKFQPVTTDSVSGQQLAAYVTDGVAGNDNRWQSNSTAPHWAQVTFPYPVQVGSAQVFSGVDDGSAMTSFKLQYLSGSTWVDVPGAAVTGNTSVETNLVFTTPVTASVFRLYDSADATVSVKELALYPPNGATGFPIGADLTLNLAQKRPAVATANTTGNYALLATDGRVHKTSMWQTSFVGSNTLEVDLRVSTKIGSAHLYSGYPGASPLASFVLRYWNGTAWVDIPGGSVTGNTSSALVIPFSSSVTTSKVQLVFTNAATSSVQELCIFPANDGNSGYPIGTGVIDEPASTAKFDDYSDDYYNITSSAVSRFITVSGGLPGLGQTAATTAQGQYQVLLNYSTGTYRLVNRATGECLSGAQLSTTPGALLVDAPYAALPDQDWILQSIDGTNFYLINQWSGLALDTQGGGTAAGTRLVQNTSTGAATQRWQFVFSTNYPKKGIGGTTFTPVFKANWAYNWGLTTTTTVPPDTIYNPMQWGDFNWSASSTSASTWKLYSTWRTTARGLHLMGFNEPDAFSQSGQSLDPNNPTDASQFSSDRSMNEAVMLWPRLMAMDQPLVSPCPANMTGGWLSSFYTQSTALGYRVDYTAKHTYESPNAGSSDNLINGLQTGYTNWGRPMWLTEFSFVDWTSTGGWTEEDNYNCLAEFLWRAEGVSWLKKYALFVFTEDANNPQPAQPWSTPTPAPRSNTYDLNGNLTAFGELYAAWDTNATVVANTPYYVHNKGTRKRLANVAAQTNVAARNIRISGDLVKWTLVSSPTSGQYYLVSSLDGRRLSSDGTSVTMVAAGTTGTAVQWRLTEKQYGWFYVEHPATSKRLQLAYNNSTSTATYTMAGNTTTTDAVQWRFILPLATPTWSGASSTSWTTAGNWAPNKTPTSFDSVIFDSTSTSNLSTVLNQDFSVLGLILTANSSPVSIGGVNSLTLGTGGIDLSGATSNLTISAPLIFSANQTWNVASGLTLSANGGVSGNASLNITGAGKVSLGGAATYTGDTTIAAGSTLQLGAANVLPNGNGFGNVIVNGTLDLNGFAETINGLSGTGSVDNTSGGAGVLTIGGNDVAITVGGIFQNTSGTLALVKTGAGTLVLSGANTHGGGFTNNGTGLVQPQNNAAFGTGPVVLNGGSLYFAGNSYTLANALTLNGATLRVTGSNRTLTWSGPVSVTADSVLSSEGGTASMTLSGGLNMNNGGYTLTSSANATANTLSAPITGASGNIWVTLGTLNLNAANTFGGAFRSVAGGPLKIGDVNALQNATLDMAAADAGTVSLNNLNATLGALTGSRNLALGSGSVSIGNNNLSTTYGGVLSGTGSLTKIGAGTLTLSNSNTYSGSTNVNGGTLALGTSNVLPATAVSIGNATLDVSTFADTVGTLDVTGAATIRLGTGAALAFANSSAVDWTGGTLTITGTFVSGASIRFGTTSAALTSAQLARISSAGFGSFILNSSGYLTASPVTGYTLWAASNAPAGTAQDDFDGDGVSNGIEYVLGGDKNTNDQGKLPQASISNGNFVFSFQRSQASIDGTTTVVIEVGTTLTTWPDSYPVPTIATTANPGVSVVKNSPSGFDSVTLTVTMAPDTRKFARLKVTP